MRKLGGLTVGFNGKTRRSRAMPYRSQFAIHLALAIMTAVSVLLFSAGPQVEASHASGTHLASIHNLSGTTGNREEYCVRTTGSSLNQSTTLGQIRNILIYENQSGDWDGVGNWKIDIWTETSAPCDQLSESRRLAIEIEYRIMDDTSPYCGTNVSCAVRSGPVYGLTQHTDYKWYNLHIRTDRYTMSDFNRHFVINHEIGHAFGLADGSCDYNSIMHYQGGCYLDWPKQADFESVTAIANYTGP